MISFDVENFSDQKLKLGTTLIFSVRKILSFCPDFPQSLLKTMVSMIFHENTVYFTIGFSIVIMD